MKFVKNPEALKVFELEMSKLNIPEEFRSELPPNSFKEMQGEFLDYVSRKELSVSFPVLSKFTNPLRNMQGGFITAAFDNVMGPLSYASARCACTTIDLNTQYIRPIKPQDTLFVISKVLMKSLQTMYITAEAYNSKEKLVATATSNIFILKV